MEAGLYWVILLLLIHTWGGYLLLLFLLSRWTKIPFKSQTIYPFVTVLLTVYNEERIVTKRIENLLDSNYPEENLEILVASDGSTDRTNEIVDGISKKDRRVKLFETKGGGKSITQNKAISSCSGEIIVLTDAGTLFERDTIKNLVSKFADKRVGCVSGKLVLSKDCASSVSESQGFYWNYEMVLRKLESTIGTLHTGSGVVMGFRKSLFRPFEPEYGDDCVIPLDILLQGYNVVHEEDAIAYDAFPSTVKGEFKARVRMTLRNFTGTLSRYFLLNPFRYPLLSFSIVSHKIFRWLTPYFMIAICITNLFLLQEGGFYEIIFYCQLLFYVLGFVGLIAEKNTFRLPVASQIFSFLLANTGFFIGVLEAMLGKQVTSYNNQR